jgi:penicillin-binding protein 1B
MLDSVRNPAGDILADFAPEARQVLDPRVAYLTQSMLEGVLTYGTAAPAVRSRGGFTAPAAGKTGTDNDAWFAGYTSNLLCIIWVGNDDYTDVHLQGADAAAPIWTEFMKRATQLPQYTDTKPFTPAPDGVGVYRIDHATGLLSDSSCPEAGRPYAFLEGTQPTGSCGRMGGVTPQALGEQLFGGQPPPAGAAPSAPTPENPAQEQKKPNIFRRIFGGAGGNNNNQNNPQQPQ